MTDSALSIELGHFSIYDAIITERSGAITFPIKPRILNVGLVALLSGECSFDEQTALLELSGGNIDWPNFIQLMRNNL
ncbi:MAG: hypothetical protein ACI9KN_002185 [Gammaproteobacteria bacterium]|jgi:hypothetical protein